MNYPNPVVRCKKCGHVFQPDLIGNGVWICPVCREKNPNLKRHYRSVADLFIFGLLLTAIGVAMGIATVGLSLMVVLGTLHAMLLLVAIVCVYRSSAPWVDRTAKALIWVVFCLAVLLNVVLPLLLYGSLNTIPLVIYAIIFPYLFWLNAQAGKCRVVVPPLPLRD